MKLDSVSRLAANRRTFLKGAGLTGLSLAGAGLLDRTLGSGAPKVSAASYSDADILNFALNLEYLEAEFYLMSTWGTNLVEYGVLTEDDTTGPTTGGQMVPNFGKYPAATIASALRTDEVAHVKYLRSALGSGAVKKPAINLNALGYGFASVSSWLELARQFEDVGISAYLGAAPMISSSTYMAAAAAILATEAQHSGSVRLSCINNGVNSPAVDSLDVPPNSQMPYDVNSNALSIPRTVNQVLNIVYAGGNHSGGFYPDGMNGTIYAQMT